MTYGQTYKPTDQRQASYDIENGFRLISKAQRDTFIIPKPYDINESAKSKITLIH